MALVEFDAQLKPNNHNPSAATPSYGLRFAVFHGRRLCEICSFPCSAITVRCLCTAAQHSPGKIIPSSNIISVGPALPVVCCGPVDNARSYGRWNPVNKDGSGFPTSTRMAERKFSRSLAKPGSAAQARETVREAVRERTSAWLPYGSRITPRHAHHRVKDCRRLRKGALTRTAQGPGTQCFHGRARRPQ
ncbi:dedicator of cytokinesis protein 11-like [Tropilaelaps mercedesae]|uniref:Dedicator of cytokinesis protein 11-like n=1 Tax=Tropilaelaps mercedesae TaxID=418985 RepID=A0A1V9X245_9ACAR|nr:dedicator of cytokinesis protein 11-like [Tropilaelaps mercedesae]